jgi:predicted HicB family RNase H-like nuclease
VLSENRSKRGMEARANAPRQFQCRDQHKMDRALTYAAIATGIS